ncbi:MAG: hypothetical protein CR988_07965 [Treponema sp.]|nr:MAG: hypothetical protein CR988_07965 [Treponema sp.]
MKIRAGSFEIPVTRKNIKRLRMKISPKKCTPEISAPLSVSISEIEVFANQHIDWLERNIKKMQGRRQLKNARLVLKNGGVITLWGEPYKLRITENAKRSSVTFDGETVFMKLPPETDTEKRKKVIERFYKRELKSFIYEILPHWEKTVKEKPKQIKFRSMRSKWGSCNPVKGVVTLNVKLAAVPEDCVEMVLVHELVHFKEFYHNERFKKYMTKYLPDWRNTVKKLKAF